MSWLSGRNIIVAGASLGAIAFLGPRVMKSTSGNIFITPASKSIGERYSSAGGSQTHLPGVATPLGSPDKVTSIQTKSNGVDSPKFKEAQKEQQVSQPGALGKAFNKAQYGNEMGK